MNTALAEKRLNPALYHLIGRFQDTDVISFPFPHIYLTRCFPQDYYDALLANLPHDGAYTDRTYDNRAMVSTRDLNTPFWKDLSEWMMSYELISTVLEAFGLNERNISLDVRLVRDNAGYAIKPHTDVKRKLLSLLFYLPTDESSPDSGTSVMVPKEQGFTSDGSRRYEFEGFDVVRTMSFMPNTMLGFPRSDVSFHGVYPTTLQERNVLLLNLYKVK